MEQINGSIFLRAIKEGGNRIIAMRRELNSINVFPVADADTGNNLASLMRSINEIMGHDNEGTSFSDVLQAIANRSLEGGKGNSGMIFAQYLNGVYHFYGDSHDNIELLIDSFSSAVDYAYESVQVPEEGTILTVMRVWSDELKESFSNNSLSHAMQSARDSAYNALLKTRQQHKLMKQNNVVDAGAKGFFLFVEGMTDVLTDSKNDSDIKTIQPHKIDNLDMPHEVNSIPHHKYCMELLLRPVKEDLNISELLESFGDSIVIVKGEERWKVHIHTDVPQKITEILQKHTSVLRIKIDDMKQQYYDNNLNDKSIALVTDSIADLPSEVIERYNIHVLPLTILVDETEHLDKLTLDNKQLLELIDRKEHDISTSLPSQAVIARFFENLERSYDKLLFISVSSALSGTYMAVQNAIKAYEGDLEISVIDSKLNSIAQGLLVKRAGEYVDSGISFEDLVNQIEIDKGLIKIYVSVSDLEPMIQSGRIPQMLGRLLQNLGLMPIVTLDMNGKGKLTRIGFTVKQNQKTIKNMITNQQERIADILIGYTSDENDAIEWSQYLNTYADLSSACVPTSSIIALSAGKKSTAVAVMNMKGD